VAAFDDGRSRTKVGRWKTGAPLDFGLDDDSVVAAVVDGGRRRHVVRLDALPEAVRASDGVLPQPQCAVLAAAGVQLAVGGEPDAVDWSEVTLERLCSHRQCHAAASDSSQTRARLALQTGPG